MGAMKKILVDQLEAERRGEHFEMPAFLKPQPVRLHTARQLAELWESMPDELRPTAYDTMNEPPSFEDEEWAFRAGIEADQLAEAEYDWWFDLAA